MRRSEQGLTLVEVLVAAFLIGIALVPLLHLYPGTLGYAEDTELNTRLGAAAVRKAEENIATLRAGVAFDATQRQNALSSSSSRSMTIGASANYIVIIVGIRSGTITVSSVTVGGAATARLLARTNTAFGTTSRAELWGLSNPPTGTVTVAVTLSGSADHAWVAASFTNVSTSTPIGNTQTDEGNITAFDVSVGSRTASSMLVGGFEFEATGRSITQGSGQTSINTREQGTVLTTHLARETNPGDAGVDLNWTVSGAAANWVTLAAELRPGPSTAADPNGSGTCTDLSGCFLVWTTTTELSSGTAGTLKTVSVVACQDTNANSTCDSGERQVRYDTKVTSRL